ncbi:MAG: glycerophosphodiester phosphodiesterase family protein [Actinomycetota bacterium]
MRSRNTVAGLAICAIIATSCSTPTDSEQDTSTTPDSIDAQAIDVQGHRGARGLKPENTLPSFEQALDLGVTTLEFDLHFTADNDVVVWHDPAVTPDKCGLKDGAPDGIPDPDDPDTDAASLTIRALTSSELRWFDCARNPDDGRFPDQDAAPTELAGSDYGIVTLVDLFEFVAAYAASEIKTQEQRSGARVVGFNMETKRKPDRPDTIGDGFDGVNAGPFEIRILEIIESHGLTDRAVIQSFDPRSIAAIHAADAGITLASLTVDRGVLLTEVVALGATIWSPSYDTVTTDRIDEAHSLGLLVIPWTVNSERDMSQLVDSGADGIITDRPDLAVGDR